MTEIKVGYIAPIEASQIRLRSAETTPAPLPPPPSKPLEVFTPTFENGDPTQPTRETIDRALERAQWTLANLAVLPLNPLTGDLIAMSMALLHFEKGQTK